jgi:hypothetical protein
MAVGEQEDNLIPGEASSAPLPSPHVLVELSDQELARYASSLDPGDVSAASNAAWREVGAELAVRRRPARVKLLREIQAVADEARERDDAASASKRDQAIGQLASDILAPEPANRTLTRVAPIPMHANEREVERHHSSLMRRLMILSTALALVTGPIAAAQQINALVSPARPEVVVIPQASAGHAPPPRSTREALEVVLTGIPTTRIAELLALTGQKVSSSADRERLISLVLHALKA